jgi:phosphonate transport system substrate-binding protein
MSDSDLSSDRIERIKVGVAIPEDEAAARALRTDLETFCGQLSAAIGATVTGQRIDQYEDLLDAIHAGHVHFGWLPPMIALRAAARGRTLPVVLPIRSGVSTFHAALFARSSSPLKKPADLKGTRAAWVDRQSAAGYLVIRAWLRAQGVEPARVFSSEQFLGSHTAVVRAVAAGEADVGATFAHLGKGGAITEAGWGAAAMRVIACAGPIPNDVMAAGIRVPVRQIRAVQRALCGSEHPQLRAAAGRLFNAEGFVVAQASHLEPLNRLLGFVDDMRGSKLG